MRLDVLVTLLPPERSLVVAPHGILGQSFDGSGIAVDGAVDPKPQPGELMTTKAMAEGSIEGAWQDYVMPSPYATFFRYSRFGLTKADPRNVSALSGRKVPFAASSRPPRRHHMTMAQTRLPGHRAAGWPRSATLHRRHRRRRRLSLMTRRCAATGRRTLRNNKYVARTVARRPRVTCAPSARRRARRRATLPSFMDCAWFHANDEDCYCKAPIELFP